MSRLVCTVCVMDDSSGDLKFDRNGQCEACRSALARMPYEWQPGPEGQRKLDQICQRIKAEMAGQPYDIMIGLSGGVDSAYLAHFLKTNYDLRILAVHVDGGWNTAAAVRNIELLVRKLDIDLHTYVVEWSEMRDLQLAYLKASVLNQDAPQDHAFFSTLYRTAGRFGQRYFMSGVNFSSESIQSPGIGYPAMDGRNVAAIHKAHGTTSLETYPIMGPFEYLYLTRMRGKLSILKPLDYINYDKNRAKAELISKYGFIDYGGKHSESRFTKFYQDIYLPARYGYDKRRLHLSSQIVSGQLSRDAALEELSQPIISADEAMRTKKFVAKKLEISVGELEKLVAQPPVPHTHYANSAAIYSLNRVLKRLTKR